MRPKRARPSATKHHEVLADLYAKRDAQAAAEYLARQGGTQQQNAMDTAVRLGFRVEYYANSIRVDVRP